MRKHLQNLERFFQKLQFRYGENDALVMEFKNELEMLKVKKLPTAARATQDRGGQAVGESSAPWH